MKSKDRSKVVTDDDLREIFVDLVDTDVADDDELAALAALTEDEKAADWRASKQQHLAKVSDS